MPSAADIGAATAEEVSQLKDDKLDKTGTAADASKLGGKSASEYALKTDTAPDSSKLGGKTLAEIMLALYPVGAVYISANSTSPASLFGGTWESIGGRFLLGADATYTAGSTGGEAEHTLTESELPVLSGSISMHGEGAGGSVVAGVSGVFSALTVEQGYQSSAVNSGASSTSKIAFNAGSGRPHNNLPPYLAVYMWKRVS